MPRGPTLALLSGFVVLLWLVGDATTRPVGFYVTVGACWAAFWWAARSLGRERAGRDLSLGAMLLVAVLLRVLALPLPLSLSDDLYRYLWDGKLVAHGHNPYLLRPDALELEPLRDELWERTAHRDVETVYPPLAMGLFTISSQLPFPVLSWKLIVVTFDLVGCAALWALCVALAVPRQRCVWYAWNPLVVLEGAGMGHVDLVGVPFLTLALLLLVRGRTPRSQVGAGLATAAGVLVKLVPLVALPVWIRHSRRPLLFSVAAIMSVCIAVVPLWWAAEGVPPGLVRYGVSWEYNGPLFEPLWRLYDSIDLGQKVQRGFDQLEAGTGSAALANWVDPLYHYAYPQLLAKVTLVMLLGGWVLWWCWRDGDLLVASEAVVGGALLCSATFYPWYLLWVLPIAAVRSSTPWLVLSASIQLAYLPRLLHVDYFPWTYLVVWAPFLLAFVLVAVRARKMA